MVHDPAPPITDAGAFADIEPTILTRRLKVLGLVAFGVLVAMLVAGQFFVLHILDLQSVDARVLSIAGRQRGLSETLSKDALALQYATSREERAYHLEKLRQALALFEFSHRGLQQSDLALESPRNTSADIAVLFEQLEPSYQRLTSSVAAFLASALQEDAPHVLETSVLAEMLSSQEAFLTGMDKIVTRYEQEGGMLRSRQKIGGLLWRGLALFGLCCSAFFGFRPVLRQAEAQAKALVRTRKELQAKIAELEQTAEALRKSEERYRAISETSADYAFSFRNRDDGAVEFEWLTDSFARVTGYDIAEVMGKPDPWRIYVHPDDLPVLQHGRAEWNNGAMMQREFRILKKDGELRWVRSFTRPVLDAHGRILRVWGSAQDVTEYKRAGATLRETQERLALAIRGANDGLWDWDISSNVAYYSPRFAELLGLEEHECAPSVDFFFQRIHPDEVKNLGAAVRSHLKEHVGFDVECRALTKSGEYRWFQLCGKALPNGGGIPTRMAGSLRDITERKQIEAELEMRVHLSILRAEIGTTMGLNLPTALQECAFILVTSLDLAFARIWTLDESCTLLELQAHAGIEAGIKGMESQIAVGSGEVGRIAQYGQAHVTNEIQQDPLFSDTAWALQASMEDLVAFLGYPLICEERVVGVLVTLSRQPFASTVLGEFPEIANLIAQGIVRRRTEDALRQAKEAAETASLAKSEFLANMSHELRTPMNGVIGMTDLLLETGLSSDQRELADTVKTSAESLLTILNDILDFSKIEAGKWELDPLPFSLHETLDGVLKTLALRAKEKAISLRYLVASEIPDALIGDSGRLRQILINLIGNALKFTERGEVVVEVKKAGGNGQKAEPHDRERDDCQLPPANCLLEFSVRDTGIGIPPEKQRTIFDAFAQADGSTSRKYGGTGLGLTICRKLVEMMNGTIWVESEVGTGSTFHFTICLALQKEQLPRSIDPESHTAVVTLSAEAGVQGKLILLVEDNAVNQKLAARLLQKMGAQIVVAHNGKEALLFLEQQGPFDLILMDCQMPEMDGFEATAAIRRREAQERLAQCGQGSHIPIIAMTANAMKGDRERCLDAGMDDYVSKPIRPQILQAVLARWLAPTTCARNGVEDQLTALG